MSNTKDSESAMQINKEDIGKINAFFVGKIIEASDKRIVIQRSQKISVKIFVYIFGAIMGIFAIGFSGVTIYFWIDGEIDWWVSIIVIVCAAFFGLIAIIIYLQIALADKQFVIFDRENKTITQPKNAFSKKPLTYPVSQMNVFITGGGKALYSTGLKKYTGNFMGIILYQTDSIDEDAVKNIEGFWNYILAYITDDTLPTGSAFDNYR